MFKGKPRVVSGQININPAVDQLSEFSRDYPFFCLYHSNTSPGQSGYETLAAFSTLRKNPFQWSDQHDPPSGKWQFGFLGYDLKNRFEDLHSNGSDGIGFPDSLFFEPELLVTGREGKIRIEGEASERAALSAFIAKPNNPSHSTPNMLPELNIRARFSKAEYLRRVQEIKKHILKGDVYELNFCQEFYAENALIDPVDVYRRLNAITRAPFSAFCRFGDQYLISSSPERFLKKEGAHLISQPIKGTRKRGMSAEEDDLLKKALLENEKERAENVMIVDLVRNDLSRIARKGSVHVDELLGLYSFEQVHQLISTVSCELKDACSFREIIRATFPMGSMTGAPKIRAMQLIEAFETVKRGLYSGAIGYIAPEGDFDFSVVIRSIQYNASTKYLSLMTGSAITSKSDAEEEYEECLLKARGMLKALNAVLIP